MAESAARRNGSARQEPKEIERLPLFGKGTAGGGYVPRKMRSFDTGGGLSSFLFGMDPDLGGREFIDRPFEQDPIVNACITARRNAVQGVPLKLWTADPETVEDAKEAPEDDPLYVLLKRPNPMQTGADFLGQGVVHRALTGEDFWILWDGTGFVKAADSGTIPLPKALFSRSGGAFSADEDALGNVRAWNVSLASTSQRISPWQVVHFRNYDPHNPNRGLGPVEVLHSVIDTDYQAMRYQRALLKNSGNPGAWLILGEGVDYDQSKRIETEVGEAWDNTEAGKVQVFPGGKDAKLVPYPHKPRDMEYREMVLHHLRVKCAVLGVAPTIIGFMDQATDSNVSNYERAFWTGGNGIIAYLRSVEDTINQGFIPRLSDRKYRGWVVRFDTSDIEALQEDRGEQVDTAYKLWQMGVPAADALALAKLDAEPFDGSDIPWIPSTVRPYEQAIKEPEPPPMPVPPVGQVSDEPAVADEQRAADSTVVRTGESHGSVDLKAPPPPRSDPEARAEWRRAYARRFGDAILAAGEAEVRRKYESWAERYLSAQTKRLEDIAANGPDARKVKAWVFETRASSDDLTDEQIETLLLIQEEWAEKLVKAVSDPLDSIFARAGVDFAEEYGGSFIGMFDPDVIDYLSNQKVLLAEGHTSTLAIEIKEAMVRAFEEGPVSVGTLQEIVLEKLPELKGAVRQAYGPNEVRALRIARTESGKAANGARFLQMEADEIEKHEWASSEDAHVRESHATLDGQIVEVGTEFKDGLKHPHDPSAPAKEVVNCRCTTIAYFDEDEDDDE